MGKITTFCCVGTCNYVIDVTLTEGESKEVIGDACESCKEAMKPKKGFKKAPKLSVVINDSKDFDKMMNDRKVQNQPKKRAKR